MDKQLFFNNGHCTVDVDSGATLTLSDLGTLPPSLAAGEFFVLTYETETSYEVIRVDSISGFVLTVQRAWEGVQGTLPSGTVLTARMTARSAQDYTLLGDVPDTGDFVVGYDDTGALTLYDGAADSASVTLVKAESYPTTYVNDNFMVDVTSLPKVALPNGTYGSYNWNSALNVVGIRSKTNGLNAGFSAVMFYNPVTLSVLFHKSGIACDRMLGPYYSHDNAKAILVWQVEDQPTDTMDMHFLVIDTTTWTEDREDVFQSGDYSMPDAAGTNWYGPKSGGVYTGGLAIGWQRDPGSDSFASNFDTVWTKYDVAAGTLAVIQTEENKSGRGMISDDGAKFFLAAEFVGQDGFGLGYCEGKIYDATSGAVSILYTFNPIYNSNNPSWVTSGRYGAPKKYVMERATFMMYEVDFTNNQLVLAKDFTTEGIFSFRYFGALGGFLCDDGTTTLSVYEEDPVTLRTGGPTYTTVLSVGNGAVDANTFPLCYVNSFPWGSIDFSTGTYLAAAPQLTADDIGLEQEVV